MNQDQRSLIEGLRNRHLMMSGAVNQIVQASDAHLVALRGISDNLRQMLAGDLPEELRAKTAELDRQVSEVAHQISSIVNAEAANLAVRVNEVTSQFDQLASPTVEPPTGAEEIVNEDTDQDQTPSGQVQIPPDAPESAGE